MQTPLIPLLRRSSAICLLATVGAVFFLSATAQSSAAPARSQKAQRQHPGVGHLRAMKGHQRNLLRAKHNKDHTGQPHAYSEGYGGSIGSKRHKHIVLEQQQTNHGPGVRPLNGASFSKGAARTAQIRPPPKPGATINGSTHPNKR